jgi:hypothetical protein
MGLDYLEGAIGRGVVNDNDLKGDTTLPVEDGVEVLVKECLAVEVHDYYGDERRCVFHVQ